MGRPYNKLTDRTVKSLKNPGEYPDGNRLYLQVSNSGTKSWVLRYQLNGKRREMGLGSANVVSLAEARQEANRVAKLLHEKRDPIDERNTAYAAKRALEAKSKTFDECATAHIESKRSGWKSRKHAQQWESTLATYASPIIGNLPVANIDTDCILRVLEPIWNTTNETASRLRGRIEAILDWATVRGYRHEPNPARWKGHLAALLPAPAKVQKNKNQPSLPYTQIQAFIQTLRKREDIGRLAFEFCILTVARTNEVLGAKWEEIDDAARLWTIPKERMKAGKEHTIPLADRCMEILNEVKALSGGKGYIFPGRKTDSPLSDMVFLMLLRRMSAKGIVWLDAKGVPITAHGFRSTFRDWAGETTAYPRETIEHAMAHQLKDKAEAAYARGTLLEKRRLLMKDWASYCDATN